MGIDWNTDNNAQVMELSVNDPSMGRKKLLLNLVMLDFVILNGIVLYLGFTNPQDLLTPVLIGLIPLNLAILLENVFLSYVLGKSFDPICIRSDGIRFPKRAFLSLVRRSNFVKSNEIATVRVKGCSFADQGYEPSHHKSMSITTKGGKVYDTGTRLGSEIDRTVEWMNENWKLGTESSSTWFETPTATQIAGESRGRVVESNLAPRYCPNCGKECDYSLSFCTSCGRMLDQTVVTQEETKTTPIQNSYEDRVIGPQWVGPQNISYQYGYEQTPQAPSNPYAPPSYQTQYAYRERSAPPFAVPNDRYRCEKDPKKAYNYALVFGFLGFMGIGHLYLGKLLKGLFFLFVGGFFAYLSVFSMYFMATNTEPIWLAKVIATLILSTPYLILQTIQVLDVKRLDKGMYPGYGRY